MYKRRFYCVCSAKCPKTRRLFTIMWKQPLSLYKSYHRAWYRKLGRAKFFELNGVGLPLPTCMLHVHCMAIFLAGRGFGHPCVWSTASSSDFRSISLEFPQGLTSPRLASPHFTSPHLAWPSNPELCMSTEWPNGTLSLREFHNARANVIELNHANENCSISPSSSSDF